MNDGRYFWEILEGIIGKILSIIGSSLLAISMTFDIFMPSVSSRERRTLIGRPHKD